MKRGWVTYSVCMGLLSALLAGSAGQAQEPDPRWYERRGPGSYVPPTGHTNAPPYSGSYEPGVSNDGRGFADQRDTSARQNDDVDYPQPQWRDRSAASRQQFRTEPRVITVPSSRVGSNVILGGTVVPHREVTLAAQLPGRIEYIAGSEGDWFQRGDLLLAINDDNLLAKRRQAMAELQNAQVALGNAHVQYSREYWAPRSRSPGQFPGMGMPNLFDQMFTRRMGDWMGYGNPPLERSADLYSYGSKVEQAEARLEQARSAIDEIEAKLRDARAEAPFSGVITAKLVDEGDTVQPGQSLLRFADTQYLQLRVDVPARLVPGLEMGMVVPVKLDIGDTRVDAQVARIFPVADPQRHTVTVKFDLPQDTPGGPGMYAEVLLPDPNAMVRNLPVIPYDAVVWRGSLPAVFALDRQGDPQLRMVRLGEGMGNNTVAVLSGLQAGEQILVNPAPGMSSDWSTQRGENPDK